MSLIEERVRYLFEVSIESKIAAADVLPIDVAKAGLRLVNCLLNDGKILVCGSGMSAANALHFSAAMLHHCDVERPPLPVIVLGVDPVLSGALLHDGHTEQLFARQIQAFARENDVLLTLSTSGNANSVLQAVHAAHEYDMDIVALNAGDGGVLSNHLGPEDIELRVSNDNAFRVFEAHVFILHCFCDVIEQSLFGALLHKDESI